MLLAPSIALGPAEAFQYRRAHSLFWAGPAGSKWPSWRRHSSPPPDAPAASRAPRLLQSNATLTRLSLSENQIGEEGAEELAGALWSNATLTELKLFGNNAIGDEAEGALRSAWGDRGGLSLPIPPPS